MLNNNVPNYKDPEVPKPPNATPEQIFDFLMATDKREKFNYKIALIAMTGVLAISTVGNIMQAMNRHVETIFIPVEEGSTKMPIGMRAGSQSTYQPNEKMYKHFLADYIRNVRTKTLDPVVDNNNLIRAQKYMNTVARNKLSSIIQEEKKLESNETVSSVAATIQVEIISVVPVKDHSYQIRWKENLYDVTGQKMKSRSMTGTFITELLTQEQSGASIEDLLVNPMGLYITDFSWDKDVGG